MLSCDVAIIFVWTGGVAITTGLSGTLPNVCLLTIGVPIVSRVLGGVVGRLIVSSDCALNNGVVEDSKSS